MGALSDLFRVLAASLLFFWAAPLLSRRLASDAPIPWEQDLLPSFIRAVVVYQITGITLGCWHLGLAGAVFAVTILWVATEVTFSTQRRVTLKPSWWREGAVCLALWTEDQGWRTTSTRARSFLTQLLSSPLSTALAAIAVAALPAKIGFPLSCQRFLDLGTYNRVMSLHLLVQGGSWIPDGSVAFLIPVAQFSGADPTAVIRWTGPLFQVGLLLALAYSAWVWTRSLAAACLAPLVLEGYQRWIAVRPPGEATAGDIAVVFWLLATSLARRSKLYALGACLLALSVQFQIPIALAPALAALLAAIVVGRLGHLTPYEPTVKTLVPATFVCGFILFVTGATPPEDGPIQYEASARTVARIVAERPRNRFLVVSPTQEGIAVHGRGWHEDLANFVTKFRSEVPIQPSFRFPYTTAEVFVFVEKKPLPQPEASPASTFDTNSYYYYTRLGRTSLQFQAAQIMASYARTHRNSSIYYEDDRLMVHHIQLAPARGD